MNIEVAKQFTNWKFNNTNKKYVVLKNKSQFFTSDATVVYYDILDRPRPSGFLFGSVSVHWTIFIRGRMRRHAPDLLALWFVDVLILLLIAKLISFILLLVLLQCFRIVSL